MTRFLFSLILLMASVRVFGQVAPMPFHTCKNEAQHLLSLKIEAASSIGSVGISLRNESPRPIKVDTNDPENMFAARILDSSGKPVELTAIGRGLYFPSKNSVKVGSWLIGPVDLQPGASLDFTWKVSSYFDLTKPGLYQVTLKADSNGRSICSNTIVLDSHGLN